MGWYQNKKETEGEEISLYIVVLIGCGYHKMIMVYCFASKKVGIWQYILIFVGGAMCVGLCRVIGKRWLDIEAQVQSWWLPHPPLRLVYPSPFLPSTHHSVVVNWCLRVNQERCGTCFYLLLLLTVCVFVGIHYSLLVYSWKWTCNLFIASRAVCFSWHKAMGHATSEWRGKAWRGRS
jgi:hypothetical protein